jgi:hypothetical protein
MNRLTRMLSGFLFVVAFLLAALALWERVAELCGYLVLGGQYRPWRLLEFSAVTLLFVIALQLQQIKVSLCARGSD